MPSYDNEGVTRLQAIQDIIDSLKTSYPDAKRFYLEIGFEWKETEMYDDGAELCPTVKLNIER